ncbi:uncharacterized protein LOC112591999 [Melanaphis sacchari]|uniref:uncharacterized protein LOC112591999 n=1 Tax=Melanaphis sacchari TaxID=742174 RepID=UPI000DC13077|nr:uncharacterized protein LOC112591999 [Melanaphis sacchari]
MVLMVIVDAQYQFILCDFGTNGRVSDAGVLQNTKFFQMLQNNELNIPAEELVTNSSRHLPYVFVADDAFQLRSDIMKPFRQADLTSSEKKNIQLSCITSKENRRERFRNFGTRFRIFHTNINLNPKKIESIVMESCVLHNYLIKKVPNLYAPTDGFDREQIDNGTTLEGYDSSNSAMEPLDAKNPRNIAKTSKMIKEEFMNYFNNEGSVPWQNYFI